MPYLAKKSSQKSTMIFTDYAGRLLVGITLIFIVWIGMHVFIISCWTRFQRKYNIDNCVLIVIFE